MDGNDIPSSALPINRDYNYATDLEKLLDESDEEIEELCTVDEKQWSPSDIQLSPLDDSFLLETSELMTELQTIQPHYLPFMNDPSSSFRIDSRYPFTHVPLNPDELLSQFSTYLQNLTQEQENDIKALLVQSPVLNYRMALMTPMESYIHLTRDPVQRHHTLAGLRDEKIDVARRFLASQAHGIDVEKQFFLLDAFQQFGKYYTVDFCIAKLDGVTVHDVYEIIYEHFVGTGDTVAKLLGSRESREYFDGVLNEWIRARFVERVHLSKKKPSDRDSVIQESNTVYYYQEFGSTVVCMCDYIDQDDLHPYQPRQRIRKDKTVGLQLEPYIDSKGQNCVIMKRFSFVKHHFNYFPSTPEITQAISMKVILWGQAVRAAVLKKQRQM